MSLVGRLVYFPNIVISMVRSASKFKPSNVVTFRIPTFMNKYDVKEYFAKIYGLDVKNVRIHNFIGRRKLGGRYSQGKKNADVEFSETFKYPE